MSNDNTNNRPPSNWLSDLRARTKIPSRLVGHSSAITEPAPKVDPPKHAPTQHLNGAVVDTAKRVYVGKHLPGLLKKYSFVLVGKNSYVAAWKRELLPGGGEQEVLHLITLQAFNQHYADKKDVDDEGNKVAVTKRFLEKAKRFDGGLVYEPGQGPIVGDCLNMWRGFGVKPKAGHWPVLKQHVTEVLAAGNQEYADYIIKWISWTFQNPGTQAEVILTFKGGKGSGKGVFGRAMCRIFGSHGMQISSPEHLVGKHNKHLQHCSLLLADEAFWGGDKKNEGVLKRLATEPTITIEPKGIDAFSVKNCLHIIMASNESWVVPASGDERRFAVFDVSNSRVGDQNYFKALYQEIENGGLGAMLYELKHVDLGGWHPRQDIPDTEALAEQKRRTMKGVDQLIFNMAMDGRLPALAGPRMKKIVRVLITDNEDLGLGFIAYAKRTTKGLSYHTGAQIKAELIKEWDAKPYRAGGKAGIYMPPLKELRAKVDKKFGKQTWDNPDLEDWEMPIDDEDEGSTSNKRLV